MSSTSEPLPMSGSSRRGPFALGQRVQLRDPKGHLHTITLMAGGHFHTRHGAISHDDLVGSPEGVVVTSTNGRPYIAFRPLLRDYVLGMPRGATIVYPKDSAAIIGLADIYPGARVVEAGAGSGALTCALLQAAGERGHVWSYERREDFADIASRNVETFFGGPPATYTLVRGDLGLAGTGVEGAPPSPPDAGVDRVVLDMVAPWECVALSARLLTSGGVLVAYVATTTQLSRLVETVRVDARWTEPEASETIVRPWHLEGLAVRPDHRMIGHTGFLVSTRRLADGTVLPPRRTRPSKGYGEDYDGPGSEATT